MNSICTSSEPAKENNISFVKEIQMMMFGLGDSPTPLVSTASVIEEVVLRQLVSIIMQAEEIAERRGVDGIYPQDILFLMRKDVHKLNRIVTYIGFKEFKKSVTSSLNEGDMPGLEDLMSSADTTKTESKRKQTCVQFLLTLGINLDEIASIDAVKQERLRRADLRNQILSQKAFEDYNASRRATFLGARLNIGRFTEWLRQAPDCPVHKLKTFTAEMLVYLAKETVAQLVDQALLLRRDTAVTPHDPFARAQRTCLPFQTFGPSQRQLEGPPPITPSEVREVLRRFYSTQLHPWGAFTCNLDPAVFNKILAC